MYCVNLSDYSKQGNTANLNIFFLNEKRAAQVGFKHMTYMYCLHVRIPSSVQIIYIEYSLHTVGMGTCAKNYLIRQF